MSLPLKVWSGSEWIDIGVQGGTVLYQNEAPASPETGMIWIDADSETSVLNDEDYLTLSTASATYAPSASPTFTGEVNLPGTTNYDGSLLSDTLASKLDTSTGYAYNSTVYFTSSGTFTKASYPWLRAIKVKVQGGGGGGAGQGTINRSSGGGGGGGYAEKLITDIAGLAASVTVTVGAGGAAGAAGNNAGGSGGSSVFGSSPSVTGGGGLGGNPLYGNPAAGGSGGDLNIQGGWGHNGGSVAGVPGGNGGDSYLGHGGRGRNTSTEGAGIAGTGYGGGGGGAYRTATDQAGGAGAPGIVIVELYA